MNLANGRLPIDREKLLAMSGTLALFLILSITNPTTFLSSFNIGTLLAFATTYFVAAVGLTFVILIGSIDLSIGSMLSLFTVVFVLMINSIGYLAYPLIMLIGLGFGLLNGFVFTGLKIPSFIGTFGAAGVIQSLALIVSGGRPIGIQPDRLSRLSFLTAQYGILRGSYILGFSLFVIFLIVQNYTPFGKYVFAIGNSERATGLSGIRVSRTKTLCFAISGLSAALAAMVLVSRMLSGDPTIGAPYQLQVIATVVVGGTALSGGSGGIFNTLLGTFIIVFVGNGMNVAGINVYYQLIITGIITMVAVALTLDKTKVKIVK
ncbi:MAG TPA: ABC transporter permease [Atribacteraceae bacterium]|nr:ABC transporter permease [Atribacteraceae bacterium]